MAKKLTEETDAKTITVPAADALQPSPSALAKVDVFAEEVDAYKAFPINTAEDCAVGLAVIDKCKEAIKAIDRIFNEPTDLAHKLWKSLTTRRAALKSPFETLKANMESRIRAWKQKAETEQRIRQLEETKRQEEKARQERELQSILLDLGGEADIADALLEAPVVTPPVIIADQMPEGLATRDNWKAVVDDLMELARGVAEGKVPLVAIYANQPWLNTQARTHREALKDMIPGVHAVNEEVIL